ncbi:MAG: hypothetical protein FGM50_12335 [Mycobacterium sp.]|nr:hypothetical protein [Mycobacterium sp.]
MTTRRLASAALAIVLMLTAGWLWWDAHTRTAAERAGNDALATARESIAAMGTYRPDDAGQVLPAARDLLTGAFLDNYTQAIQTVVIPNATQRRMASTVTVPAAGVISAESDRAVLLAYVNQSISEGAEKPVVNPARYRVAMEKVDGRWLIAAFDQI